MYTAETPANPLVREFVDFALSDEGQRLVEEAGFVSLAVRTQALPPPARAPKDYRSEAKGAQRLSVNFRFRPGGSILDSRARRDIDRVAKFLSMPDNRSKRVLLQGFDDNGGPEKEHVLLSEERAEAVAKELHDHGVAAYKVTGWGSAMPIAPNNTDNGRERNRRVEVWIR